MSLTHLVEEQPYKGPLSYEIEDAAYFFGRDRASELLLAKILSARFSLLHAQSGAGKTSLLNAKVVPGLEAQGWTAIRILPRGNPSEAVRMEVLLSLLPPPSSERAALDRILDLCWPGGDPTIGEILRRVDSLRGSLSPSLRAAQSALRTALRPIESAVEIKAAGVSFRGSMRPLFLRLLRETLEISQYAEHLNAMLPAGPIVQEDTRASDLRAILDDPATAVAHGQLLADLYLPSPSLLDFFVNLMQEYGQRRTQFGLVLILDQFEELFTLFADSLNATGKQLWRLRWEFIGHLEELYERGATLPIRYVISMRDEYIAQLDSVRRFVRDLDASSFHLSFLETNEAKLAIEEPAKLFNYRYSLECYQNIFDALVREDRFVEPAPLQIVCERLWRDREHLLTTDAEDGTRVIPLASFPTGGTRAILDSFFDEVLAALERDDDRAEALDMLEPLVTSGGTRNIIARDSLVTVPFRDAARRVKVLDALTQARVVRIEHRLGGMFVEISHEFLIASVLAKIREFSSADPEYSRFRSTIRDLERFKDVGFRGESSRLPSRRTFEAVHDMRQKIDWEGRDWAVELMLRCAVVHRAPADVIQQWAERYRRSGATDEQAAPSGAGLLQRGLGLLTLEELAVINEGESSGYTAEQIESILRSHLRRGDDRHQAHIVRWVQELKIKWQREILS